MTTSSDIVERVQRELGSLAKRLDDPSFAPTDADAAQLEGYLRDGALELARETKRVKGRIEKEASSASVELSPDVDRIEWAQWNGRDLERAETRQVLTRRREAAPSRFAVRAGELLLNATPPEKGTLALYVRLKTCLPETQMGRQLDTQMPAEFEKALVDYVAAHWARDNDAGEVYAERYQSYRAAREDAKSDGHRVRFTTRSTPSA